MPSAVDYEQREQVLGCQTGASRPESAPPPSALSRALLQRKLVQRRLQRKSQAADQVSDSSERAVDAASGSSGSPLPGPLQQRFEGSLGVDLGGVRVHTGEASAAAAESVGARAYAQGQDIHLAAGEYNPSSHEGQHLLAHEVAHTVQQGHDQHAAPQHKLEVSAPGDHQEVEADQAADAMLSGASFNVANRGSGIARKAKTPTHGVVTTAVPAAGKAPELPAGTYVKVLRKKGDDAYAVHAYSGINADAVVPKDSFKEEPALAKDKGKIPDYVYTQTTLPPWGADGPKPAEAHQGYLGDCYFIAAMESVCASNPQAIKRLFSPQTAASSYQITLFKRKGKGFQQVHHTVDNYLPSTTDGEVQYARGDGASWAGLLEKAWAVQQGSYQKIVGGWGGPAMEALTGVASKKTSPGSKHLIDKFRQLEQDNQAVAVGTKPDHGEKEHDWTPGKFKQAGDTFTASLKKWVRFSSIAINDATTGFEAQDDGKGSITPKKPGGATLVSGSIDYATGALALTFDAAKKPASAVDLQVRWDNQGKDFHPYDLIGTHEYKFDKVVEPDAVKLTNPWGFRDPVKPLQVADMKKLTNEIASNDAPSASDELSADAP